MTARALTNTYAALWMATITGVALAGLGAELQHVRAPRPVLEATLSTLGELLAHNALVALWPLTLIALGWPALTGVRRVADVLIATQLLAHGLLIGTALGQHPQLWRYLPHLPLEWLAIAIPAAAWLTARRAHPATPGPAPGGVVAIATGTLAVLAAAAAIETYLTPVS